MLALLSYLIALLLFVLAGCGQVLFGYAPVDLAYFAGAFFVGGHILGPVVVPAFIKKA